MVDPDDLQTTALLDSNSFLFEEEVRRDVGDDGCDEVYGDDGEEDVHDDGDEVAYAVDALAQQQSTSVFLPNHKDHHLSQILLTELCEFFVTQV